MQDGYLIASFDMLNVGDLDVIQQAGQMCDTLAVVVLSDTSVELALGHPPVVPAHERQALVESVRGVTHVVAESTVFAPGTSLFTTPDFFDYLSDMVDGLQVVVPLIETRSATVRDALVPLRMGEVA